MVTRRLRPLPLLLLLGLLGLLCAAAAPAQEADPVADPVAGPADGVGADPASGGEPPRRLLLLFESAPSAQLTDPERLLLYESLLVKVGRASERITVIEYDDSVPPGSDDQRSADTRARRADSWLLVTVDGRWPQLSVAARALDLLRDSVAFEIGFDRTIRRGAVELERHFWDEVSDAVSSTLPGSGRKVARVVAREELSVQAVPGTRIRGLAAEPLEVGDSGGVLVETLLPATFSLRATRLGYDPIERDFYLEPGQGVLDLAQERGSRWTFSFYLQNMNYPGFDAAFYPVPDFYWIKLGFNTFLLGLILAEDRDESMLVSYSLSHLNLSTGIYLNDADRLFRFYLGLGVFVRLIMAREWVLAFEPIAPWGLQPILGTEISRNPKLKFYAEYSPSFFFPPNPALFWLSLPIDRGPQILPMPLADPVAFWEIWVFRLGVRWLL